MKKVFVTMVFFFAIGITTLSAQDAPKPKKQQFGWNKMYMDEIGISVEVQAKVETVKKENDIEQKAVRENTSLTEEDKKKQIQALVIKRQKAIFGLVTPEQLKKSQEIQARIKAYNATLEQ